MRNKRLVLDTNVIISALLFEGNPRQVLNQVIKRDTKGYISIKLIAELFEILKKKFNFSNQKIKLLENEIVDKFTIVYPSKSVKISRDSKDNIVIETAIEAKCHYIITGDNDLLEIKKYKGVKILNPKEFLELDK